MSVGKIRWRAVAQSLSALALGGLFLFAVPAARPDVEGEDFRALSVARESLFDFAAWEVEALGDKAANSLLRPQAYMSEAEQTEFLLDYLALVGRIQQTESDIEAFYINPDILDPDAASAPLRARRDNLRAEQQSQQALAEAILQDQAAMEFAALGYGWGGQLIPPLALRFTQPPSLLVTSLRDRIERIGAYPLDHGLTVDERSHIEAQVEADQQLSALVTPLGGLAVYPSMTQETASLPWAYEVASHEWTHHYLMLYPLGFNYGTTPESYVINETVASIVGKELAWILLNRHAPNLAGDPPDYAPQPVEAPSTPATTQPPAFDFRAEMRATRIQVDDLLAAGKIEEAEAYMEARRLIFVANGYRIRRLNQAYFAFHGSYADEPGSAGADPIGPMIRELRYHSPTLKDFTDRMRWILTYDDLQAALDAARAAQ